LFLSGACHEIFATSVFFSRYGFGLCGVFTGAMRFDLDAYVNDRALDGLFLLLAEEEKKIRQDPSARVTDLLKEVFGKK
jgi:hypothetical protein